jgi:heme/copper-type cytochrome/quinol oxidase subunit 2
MLDSSELHDRWRADRRRFAFHFGSRSSPIAVQAVFIVYLVKYRRREGQRAYYCHGNNVLEIVWTSIPVLIFLGLAIYSNRLWAELHSDPPPDALQVNVSAFQFGWDFRYPGADGKLGAVEVAKISNENKFGVEESDEAGKDDLPRPNRHSLRSRWSIVEFARRYSFILRPSFVFTRMRCRTDHRGLVQGRTPGQFRACVQRLLWNRHYNMKAPIRVVSQATTNGSRSQAAATAVLRKSPRNTLLPNEIRQEI